MAGLSRRIKLSDYVKDRFPEAEMVEIVEDGDKTQRHCRIVAGTCDTRIDLNLHSSPASLKQTLFEAAKDAPDGTRFKLLNANSEASLTECRKVNDATNPNHPFWTLRWCVGGATWGPGIEPAVCHSFMDRTDFEIILPETPAQKAARHSVNYVNNHFDGLGTFEKIAIAIEHDINDWAGLKDPWRNLNADARDDIRKTWEAIIELSLDKSEGKS